MEPKETQKQISGICPQCGRTAPLTRTRDGRVLCPDCLEAFYAHCPQCGEYVKKKELEEYDPGYCGRDILLCRQCAERFGY